MSILHHNIFFIKKGKVDNSQFLGGDSYNFFVLIYVAAKAFQSLRWKQVNFQMGCNWTFGANGGLVLNLTQRALRRKNRFLQTRPSTSPSKLLLAVIVAYSVWYGVIWSLFIVNPKYYSFLLFYFICNGFPKRKYLFRAIAKDSRGKDYIRLFRYERYVLNCFWVSPSLFLIL